MKVNKISPEQKSKTKEKFEVFETKLEKKELALGYIKLDPSLFAYYFFTNPSDFDKRFKVFPFQDIVVNEKHDRVVLVIARQTGKSTIAAIRALFRAFWTDNALILVISSTKEQAKELIHRMRTFLNTSRFTTWTEHGTKDSKTEIRLKNSNKKTESRIISVPATDAARGYSPTEVILDEADFIENGEYFFKHVVLPMVQNTKGSISIYTTPNPHKRGGFVYEAANSSEWNVYQFDWKVNPNTTEKEIERLKKMMTISEFNCEYMAQFPTTEYSFFKESLVKAAADPDAGLGTTLPTGAVLVGGVDFAKISDKSIIYLGYIENLNDKSYEQIVNVWLRRVVPLGTDYSAVLSEIRNLQTRYGVSKWFFDATGVGEAPADILSKEGINIEPIKFTMQSKCDIYNNLKLLFEQKRIKIPDERELHTQLIMMEHEYLGYNKLKIHHPEGGHDDEADALALMAYGFVQSVPVTCEIIGGSGVTHKSKQLVYCKKCQDYHWGECNAMRN